MRDRFVRRGKAPTLRLTQKKKEGKPPTEEGGERPCEGKKKKRRTGSKVNPF